MTGKIKSYVTARAFGFITPDAGGSDLFFHVTALVKRWDIQPGDAVQFEKQQGDKGPKAVHVLKRCAEINSLTRPPATLSHPMGEGLGVRGN